MIFDEEGLSGKGNYSLFNLSGQMVLSGSFKLEDGLNTPSLAVDAALEGLYILRLQIGEQQFSKKLLLHR